MITKKVAKTMTSLTCTGVNAKLDVNPEVVPPMPWCFSLNLEVINLK